jgi:hypothetical protein
MCYLKTKMIKLNIILIVLLVSCRQDKRVEKVVESPKIKSEKIEVKQIQNLNRTYALLIDTLKIDSQEFIVVQNDPREDRNMNLSILNSKKDTVYTHDGFASNGFEFEDFDNNGILDIRLYQITNVGGISELIFFDEKNKIFKAVKEFDSFPEPVKIKNTQYWFSYHRSGCADINWGSELFKIENFKAIKIGEIEGLGCEDEKENGIFIYKTKGNSRKRIYSEKRKPGYYNDKWDFIEKYWNENYRKFE